jgi:hypothetical protein
MNIQKLYKIESDYASIKSLLIYFFYYYFSHFAIQNKTKIDINNNNNNKQTNNSVRKLTCCNYKYGVPTPGITNPKHMETKGEI